MVENEDCLFGKDKLVVLGEIKIGMKEFNNPYFYGVVANRSKSPVSYASILFKIYDSSNKIVDMTSGALRKGENIMPDEEINFEAICFGLSSIKQISRHEHSIFYLDSRR